MSAEFHDVNDEVDPEKVQGWIDGLDWGYPSPLRPCEGCGGSYFRRGTSVMCDVCTKKCGHDKRLCGRKVYVNGSYHPVSVCVICGSMIPLRKGAGPGRWVFRDNRISRPPEPCARCGSFTGTEEHHWAPVAIFGFSEADRWPTSWLCPKCHRTWHTQIRKAKGYSLPPEERIDDSCGLGGME